MTGLLMQRRRSCRSFFNQRSVLLGNLIHLRDGVMNLLNPFGLLLVCQGDLTHDLGDALDAGDHVLHKVGNKVLLKGSCGKVEIMASGCEKRGYF
jgi:hypothetical protein